MAANLAYIKGPPDFVYGDDADLFLDRFIAFTAAAKCEKGSQFGLLLGHLDDRSLRRVQAITFGDEHKTDDVVDISKNSVITLIKKAISKSPDLPERISLRFKVQGPDEGTIEFGDGVRLLGQKVYGTDFESNQVVIESFCAGLRDANLASKMLQKKFANLTEAINYAATRKETVNIKNVLVKQRGAGVSPNTNVSLHPVEVKPVTNVDEVNCNPADNQEKSRYIPRNEQGSSTYVPRQSGHFQATYTAPRSVRPRNNDIVCYGCHQIGHIRRFCPNSRVSSGGNTRGSVVNNRYVPRYSGRHQPTQGLNFRPSPGRLGTPIINQSRGNVWRHQ